MNVFLIIAIVMAVILFMLQKKFIIGQAMFVATLIIWGATFSSFEVFWRSAYDTVAQGRTYELLFALYFVMCLEIILRVTGTLSGLMQALQKWFSSTRMTLALMPAFLGMLPSLGGALFSAPIVEKASERTSLDKEEKTIINFWFRHIVEYTNPINPGMILASAISSIPLSQIIGQIGWLTPVSFVLGWIFCMPAVKNDNAIPADAPAEIINSNRQNIIDFSLAFVPIVLNFFMVVFFKMGAALSMAIVTVGVFLIMRNTRKTIGFKEVFVGAFDKKLMFNVFSILFFVQILTNTHLLEQIVASLQTSPLPIGAVIAITSFLIGMLTGISQGHVAIIIPIVVGIAPNDVGLVAWAMIFGIAGQMITPTHLCLIVTLDYFKANFFKTLRPVIIMEAILVAIYVAVQMLF